MIRLPVALLVSLSASSCSDRVMPPPLPRLDIDPQSVTVSGVSSGGYMATQFQVAHGALIAGAAVVAAGPYYCSEGQLGLALERCMTAAREAIPVPALVSAARALAASGEIDALETLAADRVWVFHGTLDETVSAGVTQSLVDFYREFIAAPQIAFEFDTTAAHTFPTLASGTDCAVAESPYVGACGFDGAGALLRQMYGTLEPRSDAGSGLRRFDQRPYRERSGSAGLADEGLLFLPSACATHARCRLHIVFHGCRQGMEFVEDHFASLAGYNEWAESNAIVVLYPQVRSTFVPLNPRGCWDWWGYEGPEFATRNGPQIRAVRAMIDDIMEPGETR